MPRRSWLRSALFAPLLLWSSLAVAALPATGVWECRTTGNAANGGLFDPSVTTPGTDLSVQDAAAVGFADLVIGATTTQLTSAANPFTSAHVGNSINISAGTGFTVGWYNVRSVSGGVATMDRAVGTASSTGGVGNLGGALDHPATACGPFVAGNTLWIRAGTYDCGTTSNASGGKLSLAASATSTAPNRITGYTTTRGDGAPTRPILRAAATGVTLLTVSGSYTYVEGLEFQGNGFATSKGLALTGSNAQVSRCKFSALAAANPVDIGGSWSLVADCEAVSCTGGAFYVVSGSAIRLSRCVARACAGPSFYFNTTTGSSCDECVSISPTGSQPNFYTGNSNAAVFTRCTSYGGPAGGFSLGGSTNLDRCLAVNAGSYGFLVNSGGIGPTVRMSSCAGYNNTGGNLDGNQVTTGFIALTADPFANAAGLDLGLNNVAGGGALLRGVARTLPGLAGTSYSDVGAYQSQATSGGGFLPLSGGGVVR